MGPRTNTETPGARHERLRRRLIAARALADLTVEQLAAEIRERGYERGYSAKTLGKMERGETPIQPQTWPVLAEACGLPAEFFTVDFSRLGEPANTDAARLDALEAKVEELRQTLALEALRRVAAENAPAATQPGADPRRTSSGGSGQ